ncbi:hypothetical protein [Modestobacter sp. SYSU DS0875]
MDTNEAINALVTAGQGSEVGALLKEEGEAAHRAYRSISDDHTRTDEFKRQELARHYLSRRKTLESKLTDMASKAIGSDRDDAERVFGVKGLAGDAASLAISRRDAADRVAAVQDRDELRDLLRRATRSGDEVLAHAVAERAVEMQDPETMTQFVADRPTLGSAAERLWNAKQAENRSLNQRFQMTMLLGSLRPSELGGMYIGDIEMLAAGEPASRAAR